MILLDEHPAVRKQQLLNGLLIAFVGIATLYLWLTRQENIFAYVLAFLLCVTRFFTCPHFEEKNLLKNLLNTYLFIFGVSLAWEAPVSTFHCALFFYLSILIPFFDLFRLKKTAKSKTLALALCFFLGWCGGHKFYLKKNSAWMYLLFCWTGIPAIIAIWDFIVILLCNTDYLATNQEDRLAKVLQENTFTISKTIEVNEYTLILLDDRQNKVLFFYDNPYVSPEYKIIQYDDVIDYELSTDGNSRLQGRGLMSATGAMLLGTAGLGGATGAVIGSVVGDRKVLQSATSIMVILRVNDLQNPLINVVFLDVEVGKEQREYRNALSKAQEFLSTLAYIKNKRNKK